MIRAVLFDLDGTLIDTWRLYMEAIRRTLSPHFGRTLSDIDILGLKPSAEWRLILDIVGPQKADRYFATFLREYEALHDRYCDGVYAGAIEMIDSLREQGYRLGLVTGKSRAAWTITAAKLGLDQFDVVLTDTDLQHHKPHPEGIQKALAFLGISPEHACYVGDSLLDCQAAQAAGLPFGAALWAKGKHERDRFSRATQDIACWRHLANPHALVEALAHLPAPLSESVE